MSSELDDWQVRDLAVWASGGRRLTNIRSRSTEHESLKPGLEILHRRLPPVSTDYIALETRVTNLLGRYNDYVRSDRSFP